MECNFENCPNFERLGKKFADRISELEQENDRLKEEIKNNKSAYQVELGTYNMECGNLLEENKQLWQALQEIKAIVKKNITYQDTDSTTRAMTKILGLITKAEEEWTIDLSLEFL